MFREKIEKLEKLKKLVSSPALKDMWAWSKCIRGYLAAICVCALLTSGGSLLITMTTKGLIDSAGAQARQQLIRYAVQLVAVVLGMRAVGICSSRLNARANAVFLQELRTMVLQQTLRKQYAGLGRYHSGELINRLFSDVSVIKNGILSIVPSLLAMAVSFFGAAAILISMDWRFIILMVVGALLGSVLILAFRNPMKKRHKVMQEAEDKLLAFFQESFSNLRIIKASSSENRVQRQAQQKQDAYMAVQLRNSYFSIWMNSGIGIAFQLSWLCCMLWGGRGIYLGVLTYGSLAAIIQLVNSIQGPIAGAANIAAQAYGTVSSAERLKEILDLPEEVRAEEADADELYRSLQKIAFRNVTFSYGGENVLENLNLEIKPGEFVALTGISGGGKSTMFQLLLGLYQPTDGTIDFVTDHGVEDATNRTRKLFGYVPQGNYLFSGTLRENLTMFTDAATDDQIMAAAKTACIDTFIGTLEKGLDTLLGERGLGLSEGQAQRIAIARMLLADAPILLLDESTSALDEETEAQLLANINGLRSKTCIIVTHRRAALRICDHELHLENRQIWKRTSAEQNTVI